jgi:thiamine kinase-like enzyme
VAAGHIAVWDAAMMSAAAVAGFDSEDAWAERHGQPHRIAQVLSQLEELRLAKGAVELMDLLDDVGFRRTEELIAQTPSRIERLSVLPAGLVHHDLVRSNLFALSPGATAAIDWENVGMGPLGADLAPLVSGSVRRGEASGDQLPELEEVILDGYEAALRANGVDPVNVRTAYRLAMGLRWHVVLGTITAWLDPTATGMRGSLPEEPRAESLRHLVALSRHLLNLGDATRV